MAKKRRSYQINSSDYNIAGGGGAASGNVRVMRRDTNHTSIGGQGVLYTPGTKEVPNPIKLSVEAGLAVTAALQTESYVLFEHSFEAPNANITQVTAADELPTGYSSSVPSGLTFNTNADQGDGSFGYVQFQQVTISSSATIGTYKFRFAVNQGGWSTFYIDYELDVWPQNTTPVYTSLNILVDKIIQNTSAKQYLTDTVTASQATDYNIKNVSGFATGITPQIEKTGANAGRVYVENVGATGEINAAAHSFTIEINLGAYGFHDTTFTKNISYGNPYGSRYFGPINAHVDYNGGDWRTSGDPTQRDGSYWHNFGINQGALNYITNRGRSSTPYSSTYNGVVTYIDSYNSVGSYQGQTGTQAYMTTNWQNQFVTSSNGIQQIYTWTVPNGVNQFSVVAIGAGSGGAYNWSANGGGGGGLAYCNQVTCTPGETFTVAIGISRYRVDSNNQYHSGDSFLLRDSNNEYIVIGWGGGHYSGRSAPYGWLGSSRANSSSTPSNPNTPSGNPSTLSHSSNPQHNTQQDAGSGSASQGYGTYGAWYAGWTNSYGYGGGAAGYRNHGYGGGDQGGSSNNSGGANNGRSYSSTWGGSGGGGTGADGNGVGLQDFGALYGSAHSNSNNNSYSQMGSHGYRYGGGGGSGGTRGDWGENPYTGRGHFENTNYAASGGTHGGGGGGSGSSTNAGGRGGPGCVRIIWGSVGGAQRQFPNRYTTERVEIDQQQ